MNKFEFFTMIFYTLDLYYDEKPSEELGRFLSGMCPYTFADIGSADSSIYRDFEKHVADKEKIAIEDGYDAAVEYLKTIDGVDLVTPFLAVTKEEWIEGCEQYLSKPHKGENETE